MAENKGSVGGYMTKEETSNNPYLNAKAEWFERYGDYISQAHNWRIIALAALVICVLSVAGNVIQALQFKVVPYVVSVDSLGNTHAVGIPKTLKATDIPKEAIQAELANYITNWRTVTVDADLQNRMVTRLIAYSSSSARTWLQNWFATSNPFKRAESTLVSVNMAGLPQQVAQNSWRVEWTEIIRNRQGKPLEQTRYEATISIGIAPPASEAEILLNPLGIVVAEITFNKLLQQ